MTQAMQSFAAWITTRPILLILLAIVLVQVMPPLSGALLVLDALARGPRVALLAALIASAGYVAIGLVLGASAAEVMSLTLPLLIGGASGALLAWSRSLSLAFQITVVVLIVVSLAAFLLVIDPIQVGTFMLNEALRVLELGGLDAAQLAQLTEFVQPIDMTQMLLGLLLTSSLMALLLGYWWYSLTVDGVEFGAEFRQLRLGRVAAVMLLALVAAALVADSAVLAASAPLAIAGFLFQGLAVLHARRHSEGWHRGVLVLVYLSLVSPWAFWASLGLGAVGLLDNFFTLRARTGPRD